MEFGLARVPAKQLTGGTPEENATITRDILQGRKGPKRDIVCLNAAPALVAGSKAQDFKRGFAWPAKRSIPVRRLRNLARLMACTNKGRDIMILDRFLNIRKQNFGESEAEAILRI